ncbi:hypothetical protein M404DRAFT_32723 [Pisolithus tinctorius Marx 270]|uniref:Reverse transcriptase domain-containing protein n=1 Tax=Pisolithus tinctorius Marx 270 TaxID=870435 RepID=A0A0C3IJ28_PISTI|nr:hypothetical protein M404DRAFT_32723 [Pisolithus tinctorius Marx 270]
MNNALTFPAGIKIESQDVYRKDTGQYRRDEPFHEGREEGGMDRSIEEEGRSEETEIERPGAKLKGYKMIFAMTEEDFESSGLHFESYLVESLTTELQDEEEWIKQVMKYKPVAKKVRPVATETLAEFRVERREERADKFEWDPGGFLWPEELKLVKWLVRIHEKAFAWDASERGTFREDMFPPLKIPMVPHKPWVYRNIPIPPAIYGDIVQIIKEKIAAGVYEPSTSSYRSRWFCIVKKDGKSL